ncbi:hypothetical protein AB1N83_003924 [Pleurotus pulmonarius]
MSPRFGRPNPILGHTRTATHFTMNQQMVVALMGPQGTGKTTFMRSLGAQPNTHARSGSSTTNISTSRVSLHDGRDVTLVELPSLDDPSAVVTLGRFLTTYRRCPFVGAIYFHRLTDTREIKKDFKLFSQVLGTIPAENTVLVTTMPTADEIHNVQREVELRGSWIEATARGATVGRFSNTSESAWTILGQLFIPERPEPLPIREDNLVQFLRMRLVVTEEELGAMKALKKDAKGDEELTTYRSFFEAWRGGMRPSCPSSSIDEYSPPWQ